MAWRVQKDGTLNTENVILAFYELAYLDVFICRQPKDYLLVQESPKCLWASVSILRRRFGDPLGHFWLWHLKETPWLLSLLYKAWVGKLNSEGPWDSIYRSLSDHRNWDGAEMNSWSDQKITRAQGSDWKNNISERFLPSFAVKFIPKYIKVSILRCTCSEWDSPGFEQPL